MDRCEGCEGFVPEVLDKCPNCDLPHRSCALVRHGRAAIAGAAVMTLMACYGGPIEWELHEYLAGASVQLDVSNPTLQRLAEFSVNQAALEEAVGHSLQNKVVITPLDASTEVVVSISIGDGPALETTVLAGDPVSITVCDSVGEVYLYEPCTATLNEGFSGCTTETCTKTTSLAVTVVAGQAQVQQDLEIVVQGSDPSEPAGAQASVRWLP